MIIVSFLALSPPPLPHHLILQTSCTRETNVLNHEEFPDSTPPLIALRTEEYERDDLRGAQARTGGIRIQGQSEPMPWGK